MDKKRLKQGLFITFEGPEGCGKSTQIKKTYDKLDSLGYDVLLTREPGGTKVGEKVRDILLDTANKGMSAITEVLLFETARSRIVEEVILPALKKKKIVICDRFNDSTFVYQGYAGKVGLKDIKKIDDIATGGLKPDLTIVLDIDAKTGLERASNRGKKDRMELKTLSYHQKVRIGFLDIAKKNPKRVKVVKVKEGIDKTFVDVWNIVENKL